MTGHDPSAWLASIAEIFDGLRVDWTVVGALAANRYRATARFTTDLDTMARYDPALVSALQQAGYEVSVFADEGELPHLIRCYRGPAAIDVLLPVVEYQAVALARAVDHVLAVEDVIVHKLIAWRPRDRDDIRSILEARITLDKAYLDHWITEWDLTDRWKSFATETPGPGPTT